MGQSNYVYEDVLPEPPKKEYKGCGIIIVVIVLIVILISLIDFKPSGDPPPRTLALIQSLGMSLDGYRLTYGCYPPDCAVGINPDLDQPGECLVYYLSGSLICYAPGVSHPDYPWRHPVYQDTTPTGTGRRQLTAFMTFKSSNLVDFDRDMIPDLVDTWGTPIFYNSGTDVDGPFNQNGAARHNKGKFDIISAGYDGIFGTDDDLHTWGDEPPVPNDYDYAAMNRWAAELKKHKKK